MITDHLLRDGGFCVKTQAVGILNNTDFRETPLLSRHAAMELLPCFGEIECSFHDLGSRNTVILTTLLGLPTGLTCS